MFKTKLVLDVRKNKHVLFGDLKVGSVIKPLKWSWMADELKVCVYIHLNSILYVLNHKNIYTYVHHSKPLL